MIKKFNVITIAALLTTALSAKEYHLTESLFEQRVSLNGLIKPKVEVEVSVAPKVWSEFVVDRVVPHGTKVAKGEQLVWIDTEKVDEYILALEKDCELATVHLSKQQAELANLRERAKSDLEVAQRKHNRVIADHEHYEKVEALEEEKIANFNLKKSDWSLAYMQEELNQLKKMYEADDLLEATEEIIMQRASNGVEAAAFRKEITQNESKYRLEVELPREKVDKQHGLQVSKRALDFTQLVTPKAVREKELQVAKLELNEKVNHRKLAQVKADRAAMVITAPEAGYVYYGDFKDDTWKRDIAEKHLLKGEKLPNNKVFMTIVPEGAELVVHSSVGAFVASKIDAGVVGQSQIDSAPWIRFPSTVQSVSGTPNTRGVWSVELIASPIDGIKLNAGEMMKVIFTTYRKERALSVPVKAVKQNAAGNFYVRVKMADGQLKKTVVQLGQGTEEKVEILGGVGAGHVIVYDIE